MAKNEVSLEPSADKKEGAGENKIHNFSDRFYRTLYELLLKVHMSKATSLDEYFGLVFKAIKSDDEVPRCIAFIKRLLQMAFVNEANFAAASLLIISELLKLRQDLRLVPFSGNFGNQESETKQSMPAVKLDQAGSDDDDEERFIDVDKVQTKENAPQESQNDASQNKQKYEPFKREPKYSNAEATQLYELTALSLHSHPTVRLWSQSLLKGNPIPNYKGDPLQDFSISNFLDRIAYKDPKSQEKLEKFTQRYNGKSARMADYEKPINEYDFKNGERPEIERKEEEFMYRYLEQKDKKKPKSKTEGDEEGESGEEGDDDPEMDDFADQEIKKEMKRLQSGAGGDDDLSDEDIDVAYTDSENEEESQDDEEAELAESDDEEARQGQFLDSSDGAGSEEEGFFSDQDELQDVKLDDQDDSEEEMHSDASDDMIGADDYGDEFEHEMEEQQ